MVSKSIFPVLALGLSLTSSIRAETAQVTQADPRAIAATTTRAPVCWKPGQGRGIGMLPTTCAAGEEYNRGLCYPVCPGNMVGEGPVCWSTCPPGTQDIGVFCRSGARLLPKHSQGRGVGKMAACASGLENEAGLCYSACAARTTGVGPVCWPACQGVHNSTCGALCAVSSEACADAVAKMVSQGLLVTVEAVLTQQINPKALADLAKAFAWPVCDQN